MATKFEPQVKGLVLGLDPRQVPDLHVVEGKNFLVDAEGPYAAFGSLYLTYEKIEDFEDVATFFAEQIQTTFIFIPTGVLKYDSFSQRYYVVTTFSKRAEEAFPWSMAYVGKAYYFNKKGMPVIKYNPATDKWLELDDTNSPNIVPNPYAVTDSFGRLIIADENVVQWSAIDNGQIFENPDLGAGSQDLGLIGGGTPLAVLHTQTGFATYTTSGIMRSVRIQADNPFSHFIGSEHITLISPYSIAEIRRGAHVFLALSGLYQYLGGPQLPEEWQPLMPEYLRRNVLVNFDTTVENNPNVRFNFNVITQIFTLSLSPSDNPRFYNTGYALYLPKNDWGSFDRVHSLFGDIFIEEGINKGNNSGFYDSDGFYRAFNNLPQVEEQPDIFSFIYHQEYFQIPVHVQNEIRVAAELVDATVYDKSLYSSTGLYASDGSFISRQYTPLNSHINIGLIRLLDPEYADRYSNFIELTVGVGELIQQIIEDYNLVDPDVYEDYETVTPDVSEDWGFNVSGGQGFGAKGLSTLDGETVINNQEVELTEVAQTLKRVDYSCYLSGIYHTVQFSAFEENEQFHIKTVEPVLKPAGRK